MGLREKDREREASEEEVPAFNTGFVWMAFWMSDLRLLDWRIDSCASHSSATILLGVITLYKGRRVAENMNELLGCSSVPNANTRRRGVDNCALIYITRIPDQYTLRSLLLPRGTREE